MKNKWVLVLGVIAAVVAALMAGIEPGTVLIVAALLLCPAAMYFGMRRMSHPSDDRPCCGLENDNAKRETKIEERPEAA